jgi:3-phosphoinositide dependent protein kinase-1
MRTPRKRRQSLAPSERSARSSKSVTGGSQVFGHPGIIRLYCTFADKTSVYYVLELASNGELATVIRKYGSLDLTSTRYYAAQLIDTLEFIHEREIIHRDVKPENILLDNEMRLKVTDFGSAKILGRKEEPSETSKRSFVGSADYVSPEVLRNEPATFASDIWAFGVVLFDFITGKSPFRSATEFLTFQKVLKRELEFPEGFDPVARSLVELCLDLEPKGRPTPQEIKAHPFFAGVDWNNIWSAPAPKIRTGMSPPQPTLAQVALDSDVWAAFDDDESDGEFGDHSQEPQYDRFAAAEAVQAVDYPEDDLDPPRPAWLEEEIGPRPPRQPKPRGWSTSSSSCGGRLSGLLDTMGINPTFANRNGSGRVSRTSDRGSYDDRSPSQSRNGSPEARYRGVAHADNSRWMPLLVANERIVLSTPMSVKHTNAVPLPSFLLPSAKRRQLIMTDLPRLLAVKDDPETGEPRVKTEFQFISHPIPSHSKAAVYNHGGRDRDESAIQYILEIQEKGSKVFLLQSVSHLAFTVR